MGTIERVRGFHVFRFGAIGGENPQWLYTVLFKATICKEARPTLKVSLRPGALPEPA
jgi:hypothetical protein